MSRRVSSLMLATHPFYACWYNMLQRCYNTSHVSFKHYGKRGITVCLEWHKFENFHAAMFPTWTPGLELERSNNDKGYSPENCKWATRAEQCRNTRATKLSSSDVAEIRKLYTSMSNAELGKRFNVSASHVCRIYNGYKWVQ